MHKAAVERLGRDLGELLASHERGRSLDEFTAYRDDPIGFIREVLHGEPWSRQVEIAESVRDSPLVVVRSANAVGKDWIAARLAVWWVYARQGLALITGPTERQVREVVMGEVARAFGKARDLPGELSGPRGAGWYTRVHGHRASRLTAAARLTSCRPANIHSLTPACAG